MDGVKAVNNRVSMQMAAALRKQDLEGSASEEAIEPQAEKTREAQKQTVPSEEAVESRPEKVQEVQKQTAPSMNGSGDLINVLA